MGRLKTGLVARAPGPMDWENLGIAGTSGPKLGFSLVEWLKLEKLAYEGVVGVGGIAEEVEAESDMGAVPRLVAR